MDTGKTLDNENRELKKQRPTRKDDETRREQPSQGWAGYSW